jgi:hypothetical protein
MVRMNVYYRAYPIRENYGHMTLILLKKDLCTLGSLRVNVQYLTYAVRKSKGVLGLVEDHGSEYWMNTRIPVVLSEFVTWFR